MICQLEVNGFFKDKNTYSMSENQSFLEFYKFRTQRIIPSFQDDLAVNINI